MTGASFGSTFFAACWAVGWALFGLALIFGFCFVAATLTDRRRRSRSHPAHRGRVVAASVPRVSQTPDRPADRHTATQGPQALASALAVLADHRAGYHADHDTPDGCSFPGCSDAYWLVARTHDADL